MSEKTKETAAADATTSTTDAPTDQNPTTGPTSNVVKTPNTDAHTDADQGDKPAERGPTSLAVASSTAGAVTVLGGSALAAATGPVTAAVVTAAAVGTGVVVAVRRRRNRKAAGSAGHGMGGRSRGKVAGRGGRGLGLGGGSRRASRVAGLGRKGKGLGTRSGRSAARSGAKNAAKKRPLGATPKRGRGVTSTAKPKATGKSSLGKALGRKANPSNTRGRGAGRGPGRGKGGGNGRRNRSLLGGRSLFGGGKSTSPTSPKGKGKGGGKGKGKGKNNPKNRRRWKWFTGFTRRVAGAGRWGGKHMRRWGWWLWGPKLDPEQANPDETTDPTQPDDETTEPGKKGKKKRRKVDPDGRGPDGDQGNSPSRPVSGPVYTGAQMRFFQNLRDAIEADFVAMRNQFGEPMGGGWSDTKEAMAALAEVFNALGAQGRIFAGETHEKGGYTAAFGEIVYQLSNHSTKVGDQCQEALNTIRRAHGELVEYAESGQDGRFDRSRQND